MNGGKKNSESFNEVKIIKLKLLENAHPEKLRNLLPLHPHLLQILRKAKIIFALMSQKISLQIWTKLVLRR